MIDDETKPAKCPTCNGEDPDCPWEPGDEIFDPLKTIEYLHELPPAPKCDRCGERVCICNLHPSDPGPKCEPRVMGAFVENLPAAQQPREWRHFTHADGRIGAYSADNPTFAVLEELDRVKAELAEAKCEPRRFGSGNSEDSEPIEMHRSQVPAAQQPREIHVCFGQMGRQDSLSYEGDWRLFENFQSTFIERAAFDRVSARVDELIEDLRQESAWNKEARQERDELAGDAQLYRQRCDGLFGEVDKLRAELAEAKRQRDEFEVCFRNNYKWRINLAQEKDAAIALAEKYRAALDSLVYDINIIPEATMSQRDYIAYILKPAREALK